MSELSPGLQEIKDRFLANYANGGIEACHNMIADLAQEAELTRAVGGGTNELDSETIQLQDVLSPDEIQDRIDLTRGVTGDTIHALAQHSFALLLLQAIEKPSGAEAATGRAGEDKEQGESTVPITPATLEDIANLRPVLEQSIRHSQPPYQIITDEVEEVLQNIQESIEESNGRQYVVAKNLKGEVVGVMGLKSQPDEVMMGFAATENPAEIVNAYVALDERGQGTGKLLVKHLEQLARNSGHTEIIVNSGPRYQEFGWPFWRKRYGEPRVAEKYYDDKWDAKVWQKVLDEA